MSVTLPAPKAAPAAASAQTAPTQQQTPAAKETPTAPTQGKQEPAKAEPKAWETVNHKLTANGKEIEVPYSELVRRAALGYGAEEQMKKSVSETKAAQDAVRLIKENPEKAFELLGIDKKEWAKKMLLEAAEEELMTPEEKQWRKERADLEARAKKGDDYETTQREAQKQAVYERVKTDLTNQTIEAMKAHKVPQTKETVKRIGQKLLALHDAGFPNVTPAEIMPEIIREYQEDLKALVGTADEGAIEQFLGPDIAKKLIKAKNKDLEAAGNRSLPRLANPVKGKPQNQPSQLERKMTPREWRVAVTQKAKASQS